MCGLIIITIIILCNLSNDCFKILGLNLLLLMLLSRVLVFIILLSGIAGDVSFLGNLLLFGLIWNGIITVLAIISVYCKFFMCLKLLNAVFRFGFCRFCVTLSHGILCIIAIMPGNVKESILLHFGIIAIF